MSKKFLFSNAEGWHEESKGAFEEADFINATTGMTDAGKPIKTDATGMIDGSFIDDSDIDHGSIGGLSDDDHTQYILVAGTRAFTGNQSLGNHKLTNVSNATADSDAPNYGQVKMLMNDMDRKNSCRVATTGNLASTYLAGVLTASANGALVIDTKTLAINERVLVKNQDDAEYNGIYYVSATGDVGNPWTLTRSLDADSSSEVTGGMMTTVCEGAVNADTAWMLISNDPVVLDTTELFFDKWYISDLVGGNGITITGDTIDADLMTDGGLKFVGGQLAVEPNDFAGSGLVDDGSDNLAIDWSTAFNDAKAVKASDLNSVSNGKGASIIGIEDSSGYFTSTNVEGALKEAFEVAQGQFQLFTADGAITKGDVVYASGNNLVKKWSDLTSDHKPLGVAGETKADTQPVKVYPEGTRLNGVVSGASADAAYYWSGSALQTSKPSANGSIVIEAGVAVNATDLLVTMERVKKNAAA